LSVGIAFPYCSSVTDLTSYIGSTYFFS